MRDASPLESIRAKADCTEAATATSHSSADAFPPAARIFSTAAPAALKSRSRAKTRAPFWANVDAIARPIPDPAPVTIAFLPSSRNTPACSSDVNSKTGERYMTNDQHGAHNARDQDCLLPLCWRVGIFPDSRETRLIRPASSRVSVRADCGT